MTCSIRDTAINPIVFSNYISKKNAKLCLDIRENLLEHTNHVIGDRIDLDELIFADNLYYNGSIFNKLDLHIVDFIIQMLSTLISTAHLKVSNTHTLLGDNYTSCDQIPTEWLESITFDRCNFYLIHGSDNLFNKLFNTLENIYKQIHISTLCSHDLRDYINLSLRLFKVVLLHIDSHLTNAFSTIGTNKKLIRDLKTLTHVYFNLFKFYKDYGDFVLSEMTYPNTNPETECTTKIELEYMIYVFEFPPLSPILNNSTAFDSCK